MKEKSTSMDHQPRSESDDQIHSQPLELKNPSKSELYGDHDMKQQQGEEIAFLSTHNRNDRDKEDVAQNSFSLKTHLRNKEKIAFLQQDLDSAKNSLELDEDLGEGSGREKLKRHRVEVAGRVWIPEIWGQEELLKDWRDCSAFDASFVPSKIVTARAALVEEGTRRANAVVGGGLITENRYPELDRLRTNPPRI